MILGNELMVRVVGTTAPYNVDLYNRSVCMRVWELGNSMQLTKGMSKRMEWLRAMCVCAYVRVCVGVYVCSRGDGYIARRW